MGKRNLLRWCCLIGVTLLLVGLAMLAGPARRTGAAPLPVMPLPPVEQPDGRAGMCYSFYDPPERPYLMAAVDAGSRWDRFDFVWPNIEPQNNVWDFAAYDALVNDLRASGVNIVGMLLWTPAWALGGEGAGENVALGGRPPGWYGLEGESVRSASTSSQFTYPPDGLYLPWNHPENHWGNFVYTVVSHFRGRVYHWEIWNEPDSTSFWSGTSVDYAQLLKVGYQATKAACPECTVLFGGLHYWAKPKFYRWVLNVLNDDPAAASNNYFFDVMSVHIYSRSSDAYDVVSAVRSGMLEFVSDHPIWITEVGVPVWDDETVDPEPLPYIWSATQQEAAAFVLQTYANAWAAGADRYFYFRAHDADMREHFGLLRNDRSFRPAYVAFQVATTYLVSPTMATSWTYSNGVRRVTLWGTPRGKISVLWNTTPVTQTFDYPSTLTSATLIDQRGVTETLAAVGGVYRLVLPPATDNLGTSSEDYLIGGETFLIMEQDTVPPVATVLTPTVGAPYTITVSWEGSDDAAGVWLYDVQVRKGAGEWVGWLGLSAATSGEFGDAEPGETYCFRVRAWDRAGNVGQWSTARCVVVEVPREVSLQLDAVFGDGDGDGVLGLAEEPVAASMRLIDGNGVDVVTPTVGTSWHFTVTLLPGQYLLDLVPTDWPSPPPGWLPRRVPIAVEAGTDHLAIGPLQVGLAPHRTSLFLPLLRSD